MTAALADPYVAGLLDVRVGSPLLSMERTVYADEGRPVEFVHALYRTDLSSYMVHLTRGEDAPGKTNRRKQK
jgi:GntR family transcriptional regulator